MGHLLMPFLKLNSEADEKQFRKIAVEWQPFHEQRFGGLAWLIAQDGIGWPLSPYLGLLCVEEDFRGSSCTGASQPPLLTATWQSFLWWMAFTERAEVHFTHCCQSRH